MGLFDKKVCELCGAKAGLISRTKIQDGDYICGDCRKKMSSLTTGFSEMSLDDVKEQIRLKEENDRRYQTDFVNSRQFDIDARHPVMAVDDEHGEFVILTDKNPDIFSFDDIASYNVDLKTQYLSEEERKKNTGLSGLLDYLLSDDFGSRFPDLPSVSRNYKITGMYFQINFKANPFHAEKVRIDMLPSWSNSEVEIEKAYICSNDIYQCIKEYKEESRSMRRAQATGADNGAAAGGMEQIKQLKELLDMGAITQDEFDAKKKQILGL